MTLPPQLLYAVSQLEGGHVVLIIGAGCSKEAPTNLPLSDECALEAHRRLIADGVLVKGECANPSDLSCLADTVIAKKGKQYDLVIRLPRERFRKARPNLGHLMRSWMEQKVLIIGGYDQVREQHDEILCAIEAHDVERARSALRNHLKSTGDKLASVLLEKQS